MSLGISSYGVFTDSFQMTMGTSDPGVFCGGDLADTAETTVEAVADGKIAAWSLHRCGFI